MITSQTPPSIVRDLVNASAPTAYAPRRPAADTIQPVLVGQPLAPPVPAPRPAPPRVALNPGHIAVQIQFGERQPLLNRAREQDPVVAQQLMRIHQRSVAAAVTAGPLLTGVLTEIGVRALQRNCAADAAFFSGTLGAALFMWPVAAIRQSCVYYERRNHTHLPTVQALNETSAGIGVIVTAIVGIFGVSQGGVLLNALAPYTADTCPSSLLFAPLAGISVTAAPVTFAGAVAYFGYQAWRAEPQLADVENHLAPAEGWSGVGNRVAVHSAVAPLIVAGGTLISLIGAIGVDGSVSRSTPHDALTGWSVIAGASVVVLALIASAERFGTPAIADIRVGTAEQVGAGMAALVMSPLFLGHLIRSGDAQGDFVGVELPGVLGLYVLALASTVVGFIGWGVILGLRNCVQGAPEAVPAT